MAVASCTVCGESLPERARFCPSCGAATEGGGEEERKVVTAVFVDLVDSTAQAERADPEDVRRVLVPYFARVRTELERFGGTVEKFIGDAVMALFGVPVAHEDDPERAVRAALAIREWAAAEAELQVRIAVNTGEALVALGARPDRGERMAAGDVLNTAFRIEEGAPAGTILVGESTYRATAETIEYADAEPVAAKGKAEPVPVWRVVAARSDVAGGLRRRAPLVGRWHELDLLLDALARARRERAPQLVTLVGVPGIGKSRLVAELLAAMADASDLVAFRYGRSLPYGDGGAFSAVADLVKDEAGILKTDTAEAAGEKLRAAVAAALPAAEEAGWVEAHLRPLAGLEREGGGDRREESFAAWRRFFEALAEERALVLVLEDLHWADDALLEFVDYLLEWAAGVPLLVLCTARPELLERRHGWGGGKRNAATVALQPLSEEETTSLLRFLLEQDEIGPELLGRAAGNPLFAEEYARMLGEREGLPIPETVQGIIAARIDGLDPAQKAILRDAAVVGRTFWAGAVASLGGLNQGEAEALLNALERKEFVRREPRSSVAGETEYAFRHVLVRDVAYGQIPRAPRADKHRLAAEWIGSLAADREDQAELVAHHYVNALELARAAGQDLGLLVGGAQDALREAGDRALSMSAAASAASFYREALELGDEDPSLRLAYGKALFQAESSGASELAAASAKLLERGQHELAAEAEALLGVLAARRAATEDAFAHVERAAELVADAPTSPAKAHVLARLAGLMMASNRNREALDFGREALDMAETLGLDELRAHALTTIGAARSLAGDSAGARDLERAIEVAVAANSPESIRAYSNLANVLANEGDLRRSAHYEQEAWRSAERFGSHGVMRFLESERSILFFWQGRWEDAEGIATRIIDLAESGSPHYGEILSRQVRAKIRLARGDLDGAVDDSEKGMIAARAAGDPQSLYPALVTSARVLLAASDTAAAQRQIDELTSVWGSNLDQTTPSFWTADLVLVAEELGRSKEVLVLMSKSRSSSRWVEAAEAVIRGDLASAAALYGAIGALPEEASIRLRWGRALVQAGRRAEAERHILSAIDFFESVGADSLHREGSSLLAASL